MTDTTLTSAASAASVSAGPRTYGNWRKPSSPGLPRLGLLGTALALGSLVAVMSVQVLAGLLPAGVCALAVCAGLLPLVWRNRAGRNGWQVLAAKTAWRVGQRRRQHLYTSSLTGPVSFGSARLPGLLANSRLLSAVTAHGEPFALIHLPSTRHYAVMIALDPQGSQLIDPETVDEWVACWGGWLARLGHEANLEACTVTVETAPDPGSRLAAEVQTMLTPDAPALSRAMLTEAAASYPHGSATVTAYLTLTFSARRAARTEREGVRLSQPRRQSRRRRSRGTGTATAPRPYSSLAAAADDSPTSGTGGTRIGVRSAQEMAAQIGRRLPLLLHQLRTCGAGTGAAMTAAEVAATVRVAYDPAAAPLLDRARAQHDRLDSVSPRTGGVDALVAPLVSWQDAGPVAQVEAWDHLRHDSGTSITWQMVEVPHGAVQSRVLEQLLDANDMLARKRVTLIYRPHDPASAARVADADVRTAVGRATLRQGEGRATESLALAAARQSAAEQAIGAGLIRFSMLVTATIAGGGSGDTQQLARAAELIEQLGPACQLRLRRCYFSQAAAFTAALGVGVVLPKHVAVPDLVRDNL
jgi:hypothetical protein